MAVTKAILEKWLVAQKRHRLSDKQVQMARELGLNPDKLGKIDNHKQEAWKAPLPQFIESIYFKRFERENPETDSGNPSEKSMDGFVEVTEQMELPF